MAGGEDGDAVSDAPFFSEECEDSDSWLPVGVVPGLLLLKVSPGAENTHGAEKNMDSMPAIKAIFFFFW